MEAWIVADADALRSYYGQRFNQGALPRTDDLERVGKPTLENSLQRATERTQKGRYKKIAHASEPAEAYRCGAGEGEMPSLRAAVRRARANDRRGP